MAHKKIRGLYERNGIWHIDKIVRGVRLNESTGTSSLEEAESFLIYRLEKDRQEKIYGVRPNHSFRQAAARYLQEALEAEQSSIHISATYLEQADPFIGQLDLTQVDNQSLQPFVQWMRVEGQMPNGRPKKPSSNRTINIALERIIRVLNVCHREWRDDGVGGKRHPWLDAVPRIQKLDESKTRRPPYPISWEEQVLLMQELPAHLERMALFKVNTGTREQEVCKLRWNWEVRVPEIEASVFIVPWNFGGRSRTSGVKNREDRVIVLNDVAKSVINAQRGQHEKWVFPFEGGALHRMNDTAWQSARTRAAEKWREICGTSANTCFRNLRVHDLKHTFGRRLKAAGVGSEDRQVLLGHKGESVTSHYSAAEILNLIKAANRAMRKEANSPTLAMLRQRVA